MGISCAKKHLSRKKSIPTKQEHDSSNTFSTRDINVCVVQVLLFSFMSTKQTAWNLRFAIGMHNISLGSVVCTIKCAIKLATQFQISTASVSAGHKLYISGLCEYFGFRLHAVLPANPVRRVTASNFTHVPSENILFGI